MTQVKELPENYDIHALFLQETGVKHVNKAWKKNLLQKGYHAPWIPVTSSFTCYDFGVFFCDRTS